MTAITITTLGDLGPDFWLAAYCPHCFHWSRLPIDALAPALTLHQLRRRLRCARCHRRDARLYRGWHAGGFQIGYGTHDLTSAKGRVSHAEDSNPSKLAVEP